MAPCSVPVLKKLGLEWNWHIKVLCYSDKQVASNPELVCHFDTLAGPDLKLPLTWHNFRVRPRNLDAWIQTGLVVCIHYGSSEAVGGTHWAIVGSLSSGEPLTGPSEGFDREFVLSLKKRIFLFNPEPWVMIFYCIENVRCKMSEIGVCWFHLWELIIGPYVGFTEYDNVVVASEGVWVLGHRLENDFWVVSRRLIGRASIIVPVRDVFKLRNPLGEGLWLGPETDTCSIDPHILCNLWSLLV